MPPTNIVAGIRQLTQKQLITQIPNKWRPQFTFGIQAYSLRSFQSAACNARMVVANPNTAARKSERLLANLRLADRLGQVFDVLGLVTPTSYVNVDHSDMHEIVALVGAVQTRRGRAIPCMVEATYGLTIPGDGSANSTPRTKRLQADMREARRTQSFTGHTIDSLQGLADRLGFWPRLVFDRGFGNESIVQHLHAEGATFYIRLKAGRYVELDGQRVEIRQLPDADAAVCLYGLTLRIVRSAKNRRCKEPWFILTDDFTSSREKIIQIYYHRFEIEETFRDMKHLWELKRTWFFKPASIKTLLWFVSIGIAILYLLTKPTESVRAGRNPKKRTSWLRDAREAYQRELGRLLWVDW